MACLDRYEFHFPPFPFFLERTCYIPPPLITQMCAAGNDVSIIPSEEKKRGWICTEPFLLIILNKYLLTVIFVWYSEFYKHLLKTQSRDFLIFHFLLWKFHACLFIHSIMLTLLLPQNKWFSIQARMVYFTFIYTFYDLKRRRKSYQLTQSIKFNATIHT